MPTHLTLRMQFGLHQDPRWVRERLLELVGRAPVDEIMFFIFAEDYNDGHETLDGVREWIEHSRVYRDALREAGIAVSLNPWHSLLHADRNRRLKPGQDWQTLVDPNGRSARVQVCPLDPDWRAYYEETLRLYAKEDFRVIWVDDDIRFHNHAPLDWGGCFCRLHVAEFNRRTGESASREEIVAACTAPGKPHPWRDAWLDMWDDTQTAMIARWRDLVEAEDSKLGLMSSLPDVHAMEGRRWSAWWRAFARDGRGIHRPHFWPYNDVAADGLIDAVATLDQNRTVQPDDVESAPEIDSYQYGPWAKSYRQRAASMVLAHVLGSTGLNVSLFDFLGNDPLDMPERVAFLNAWRPVCDWLADAFPTTLRSCGVGVPWSEDMSRRVHTEKGSDPSTTPRGQTPFPSWWSLRCRPKGWTKWLGAAGHAFQMRASTTLNAIGGTLAWAFDDATLRGWLSGGVLVDGPAALVLIERGLGPLIGFASGRMVSQSELLYTTEHCLNPAFGVREGARISVNTAEVATHLTMGSGQDPLAMFQGEPAAGTRTVSDLRGPRNEVVGHGLVLFENDLGGRSAVVPWSVDAWVPMTIYRAVQLTRTLDWLERKRSHGHVEGAAWLVPQFLTDGDVWRGAVWNAGPDEVTEFTLHLPADMPAPKTLVHVDARARRHDARLTGERVTLTEPLRQWETVLLA